MNFNDYQEACLRTWNTTPSTRDQLTNAFLGLAGETGELVDQYKKFLFHGHGTPSTLELGDVLYYVAIIAHLLDMPLSVIARKNMVKLAIRYPEGFDPERSQNREE